MDNIQRLEQQAKWVIDEDWHEWHCGAEAEYDSTGYGDVITPFCAWCGKPMSNYKELVERE